MLTCVLCDGADAGDQPGAKATVAQPPTAADAFYAKLFPALEVLFNH